MAVRSAIRRKDDEKDKLEFDEYGFLVPVSRVKLLEGKKNLKQLNARVEKWRKMLPKLEQSIALNDQKLKERIRKGIPNGIRVKVWPLLSGIIQIKKQRGDQLNFQKLVETKEFPYEADIAVDLHRTFPNHQLFMNSNTAGLSALNNVLKAVSIAFPELGYCQGLNFLAAAFMIYHSDEEAFFTIISLFIRYDCEKMFEDVGSIKRQIFVHDSLVEKFLPEISEVFERFQVDSLTFATGWYMTLFSATLPFDYFLRIMDIFFAEKWKIIYRVALAILKHKKKQILDAVTFEQIQYAIKDFSEFENGTLDEDKFFKSVSKDFIFSKSLIVEFEKEYEIQNPPNKNKRPNRSLEQQSNEYNQKN